jgi:hypothetical protein
MFKIHCYKNRESKIKQAASETHPTRNAQFPADCLVMKIHRGVTQNRKCKEAFRLSIQCLNQWPWQEMRRHYAVAHGGLSAGARVSLCACSSCRHTYSIRCTIVAGELLGWASGHSCFVFLTSRGFLHLQANLATYTSCHVLYNSLSLA